MGYVTTIEEIDGIMHVEVHELGSGIGEPVALFACASLSGAVGPLRELLRLATDSGARPSDASPLIAVGRLSG